MSAFIDKALRGRQPDAAAAAGDECNFTFELAHVLLLVASRQPAGARRILPGPG
jgi:hypothetical protein